MTGERTLVNSEVELGKDTIAVMRDGAHLLAVLWESAICADPDSLPSVIIDGIGTMLVRPDR